MPKLKGEPTQPVNVRIPAYDRDKIDALISSGMFQTRSDFIARAISDWFAHDEYKEVVASAVKSEITTNPEIIQVIKSLVDAYLKSK